MRVTPILVSSLALAAISPRAHAGAPTVAAVKAALPTWTDAIALPFTYQGLVYLTDDYRFEIECQKAFGAHGIVKDAKKLPQLVRCISLTGAGAVKQGTREIRPFDPKKMPPEMERTLRALQEEEVVDKSYPAQLVKLAKGKTMVLVYTTTPNEGGTFDEAWTVFVARDDAGAIKLDALMVVKSMP